MRDADFVKIAKALADPTRHRMILEIRRAGELTCSALCERVPLSQPTISHHVKTLVAAGLISVRREGQFHVLAVNPDIVECFIADLTSCCGCSGQADVAPAPGIESLPVPASVPAPSRRRPKPASRKAKA